MAKTFTAPFAQSPKKANAVVTLACGNVATDNPTNTALLLTAGADGAIVTRLVALPRATVTAASLLLFSSTDGITFRLKDSETMAAQTVSTTAGIDETPFLNCSETKPYRLEANERLYVGSQVALAGGIAFSAEYTDFS